MTNIRDIKQEDVEELVDIAKKEGHGLWRPTSIIEVDEKIKGSLSIGGVPLITAFISKEVNSPYVLREVIRQGKDTLLNAGFQDYLIALNDDSPAFRFMPAFGLQPYASVMWYGQAQ